MDELRTILQAILENQQLTNARIDARGDRLDARIDLLDARIDSMEARLESKMESVEARLDRVHQSLQLQIDEVALDVKHIKRGVRMMEADLDATMDRVRRLEEQRSID